MTRMHVLGAAALLTLGLSALPHAGPAQAKGQPRRTPTPSVTATATLSPSATPTSTNTATATPTEAPTSTPTASPTPAFVVTASVVPDAMPYNSYPTLYGSTLPGATCTASVIYNNGYRPTSFTGSQQTAGANGLVAWGWHEETTSTGGTGTVTCSFQGQVASASATFIVTQ